MQKRDIDIFLRRYVPNPSEFRELLRDTHSVLVGAMPGEYRKVENSFADTSFLWFPFSSSEISLLPEEDWERVEAVYKARVKKAEEYLRKACTEGPCDRKPLVMPLNPSRPKRKADEYTLGDNRVVLMCNTSAYLDRVVFRNIASSLMPIPMLTYYGTYLLNTQYRVLVGAMPGEYRKVENSFADTSFLWFPFSSSEISLLPEEDWERVEAVYKARVKKAEEYLRKACTEGPCDRKPLVMPLNPSRPKRKADEYTLGDNRVVLMCNTSAYLDRVVFRNIASSLMPIPMLTYYGTYLLNTQYRCGSVEVPNAEALLKSTKKSLRLATGLAKVCISNEASTCEEEILNIAVQVMVSRVR